ncbi:MAG: ABC transporter ATP-binding protein [Pseudomonadota bacterium]
MLVCEALSKTYPTDRGPVAALRGIDLEVKSGRYAAIIGRSGSGKSSLMAMIGGLSRPSGGRVLVAGTDLWALGSDARARFRARHIGYVFQFASLLPTLRALDNAALPLLLDGRGRGARARAAALLEELGLGAHLDAFPSELSAGEQRRVVIARALVSDPGLLLADEPTSDLDAQTEREIMGLLARVHRTRGTTLLLVTHSLALAAEAEQIIQVADGTLVP